MSIAVISSQRLSLLVSLVCLVASASLIAAPAIAVDKTKAGKSDPKLGAHLQLRHSFQPPLHLPGFADSALENDPELGVNALRLRRARLWLSWAHGAWKMKLKIAFDDLAPALQDAWAETGLWRGAVVRLGRTKRVYSGSFLISSRHQRLLERAEVSDLAWHGRDLGVRMRQHLWHKRIELWAMVSNGAGVFDEVRPHLRYEARFDVMPLGSLDLGDPHIGRKAKVRIGAGATAWRLHEEHKTGKQILLARYHDRSAFSCIAALRWQGVELSGEGFLGESAPIDARSQAAVDGGVGNDPTTNFQGAYGQLAAQIPGLRDLLIAARYQVWLQEIGESQARNDRLELAASWLFDKDDVKAQLQWRREVDRPASGAETTAWEIQAQLQVLL